MDTTAAFKARIESFLKEFGMAASTFGREAARDPAFVLRLRTREIASVGTARMDRIDRWMADRRKAVAAGDPQSPLRKRA
jgi:hypothetical protein